MHLILSFNIFYTQIDENFINVTENSNYVVERFIHNILSTSHYANAGVEMLLNKTCSVLLVVH
jgi:hypothetical protein